LGVKNRYLPLLGYKKRAHLMNPMVGGLNGSKMSSSDNESKIDLLDSSEQVVSKLKKAFCEEGNIVDNPIMSFVKQVIFPINSLTNPKYTFDVLRPDQFGGNVKFASIEELEKAFAAKELHPSDFKTAAASAFNSLLDPIRLEFAASPELIELTLQAYPPPIPKISAEISRVDLRVGKVVSVESHPERDVFEN
jgi:tyrosyl-tRNA synthetase